MVTGGAVFTWKMVSLSAQFSQHTGHGNQFHSPDSSITWYLRDVWAPIERAFCYTQIHRAARASLKTLIWKSEISGQSLYPNELISGFWGGFVVSGVSFGIPSIEFEWNPEPPVPVLGMQNRFPSVVKQWKTWPSVEFHEFGSPLLAEKRKISEKRSG